MWMPAGWADKCVIRLASSYEIAWAKADVKSVTKKTDRPLPQPARSAFHSISSSTCGLISRVVRLDCLNSKQWNFLLFVSRGREQKCVETLQKQFFYRCEWTNCMGPYPSILDIWQKDVPKIPTTHETIADSTLRRALEIKIRKKIWVEIVQHLVYKWIESWGLLLGEVQFPAGFVHLFFHVCWQTFGFGYCSNGTWMNRKQWPVTLEEFPTKTQQLLAAPSWITYPVFGSIRWDAKHGPGGPR